MSTFCLQGLLSDTDLSVPDQVRGLSSTWALAESLLAAGDALPGLGITWLSELISCPAHLAFLVVSWRGWVLVLLSREVWLGSSSCSFFLGKDAVSYEADDCLGTLSLLKKRLKFYQFNTYISKKLITQLHKNYQLRRRLMNRHRQGKHGF